MKDYADKTFWKMSMGFVTIISLTILLVLFSRVYEENKNLEISKDRNIANSEIK